MDRYLGYGEKLYWLLEQTTEPLNVQVTLKLEGKLSIDIIKTALIALQEMQPLLRVSIIFDQSKNPKFEKCDANIPLKIFEFEHQKEIHKIARQELAISTLKPNLPLMRMIWMQKEDENHFIITVNHIITGGVEIVHFSKNFVEICDALINNYNLPKTSFPQRTAIEKLLPFPVENKNNSPSLKISNCCNVSPENKTKLKKKHHTSFNAFRLSKDATNALLKGTKEYKTSLHGIISACATKALESMLAKNFPRKSFPSITCMSPVNLRPFLTVKMEPNELGSHITGIATTIDTPNKLSTKKLANQIKQEITKFINEKKYIDAVNYTEKIVTTYNSPEKIISFFNQPNSPQIVVTNLGILPKPSQLLSIKLKNIDIAANLATTLNSPYSLALMLYSSNGALFFKVASVYPTVLKKQTNDFKKIFTNEIKTLTANYSGKQSRDIK